jgi:hypothetical protein
MTKLKLGPLADDKPVKLALDVPAGLFADLKAYADLIGQESGQAAPEPAKLIIPMIQRFIATDRGFAKARRNAHSGISRSERPQ